MNETWNKFVEDNKQPLIITFDFDGTLTSEKFSSRGPYSTSYEVGPNIDNVNKLKAYKKKGARVYIVTRRTKENGSIKEIINFIKLNNLPIDGLHFTNNQDKVHTLSRLGSSLHYDDDEREIEAIKQYAPHIKTVLVKVE